MAIFSVTVDFWLVDQNIKVPKYYVLSACTVNVKVFLTAFTKLYSEPMKNFMFSQVQLISFLLPSWKHNIILIDVKY